MITIVDYDMGNSRSVVNMLQRIGFKAEITRDHKKLESAEKLILPGVGSFDTAMKNLEHFELKELLDRKALIEKVPFLGICLGMQILTNSSEEGNLSGLGWIEGSASKFKSDNDIKVPHMDGTIFNHLPIADYVKISRTIRGFILFILIMCKCVRKNIHP